MLIDVASYPKTDKRGYLQIYNSVIAVALDIVKKPRLA